MLDWSEILSGTIGSVIGAAIWFFLGVIAATFWKSPKRTFKYLLDTFERKRLGSPKPWWELIGGRMWNPDTGEMTHEDADGIPTWLDKDVLESLNMMTASGLLPNFDSKCQDDDYIYWVVSGVERRRLTKLAFFRRPRLIRWFAKSSSP